MSLVYCRDISANTSTITVLYYQTHISYPLHVQELLRLWMLMYLKCSPDPPTSAATPCYTNQYFWHSSLVFPPKIWVFASL